MLFNSLEFLVFLPIVFVLYWLVLNKNLKAQNFLLLVASYVFYGWWDWRFLTLIAFSTIIDFYSAQRISNATNQTVKKRWLTLSILTNLGLLGFFKYYNFFIESWIDAFAAIGYEVSPWTMSIVLPVGISFYTFQTMSYSIDVYREKIKPSNDIVAFATFVSFFPQLVAGPIEKAEHMLPQINKRRVFSYIQNVEGLRLILWGLFKKIVIADSLAIAVDDIMANSRAATSSTIALTCIYWVVQAYCDFSGYSDIAIGTSKLFGIELKSNFKFPLFSKNIIEFWRRWHISLNVWFKDYLYIPLGGSKKGVVRTCLNLFIVFFISGLWHGAGYNYIFWGIVTGIMYILSYLHLKYKESANPSKKGIKPFGNAITNGLQIFLTFCIVSMSFLIFRVPTVSQAIVMIKKMFLMPTFEHMHGGYIWYVITLFLIEIFIMQDERTPVRIGNRILRHLFYSALIFTIIFHLDTTIQTFVYFQF